MKLIELKRELKALLEKYDATISIDEQDERPKYLSISIGIPHGEHSVRCLPLFNRKNYKIDEDYKCFSVTYKAEDITKEEVKKNVEKEKIPIKTYTKQYFEDICSMCQNLKCHIKNPIYFKNVYDIAITLERKEDSVEVSATCLEFKRDK